MSNFDLSFTGAQVNSAINRVQNADTSPVNGSTNMVTSNGVYDAVNDIQFANLNNSLVKTDISSGTNDTTLASSAAIKSYVDSNGAKSLATGWTNIAATGTATTDGFIVAYVRGSSEWDAELVVTVGGFTVRQGGTNTNDDVQITMPIAASETWSISASGISGTLQRKFKALS